MSIKRLVEECVADQRKPEYPARTAGGTNDI